MEKAVMSVELIVYLRRSAMPDPSEWQQAMAAMDLPVEWDHDFDPDTFRGFLPCKLRGVPTGFEYFAGRLSPSEAIEVGAPPGSDFTVRLVTHSDLREFVCSAVAAGALAWVSGGLLVDPQSGESYVAAAAKAWAVEQFTEAERSWAANAEPGAAPDWRGTTGFWEFKTPDAPSASEMDGSAGELLEAVAHVVGPVLLGLGITLMVVGGIALGFPPDVRGLVCIGCVAVPSIIGGIALVRWAEDRIEGGGVPPAECPAAADVEPSEILDQVWMDDLNQLNWVGWLLLLGTFWFFLAEVGFLLWMLQMLPNGWAPWLLKRGLSILVGLLMVFLAIGFFAGTRWLLRRLGISIYRRKRGRAEPGAAAEADLRDRPR